jgi:hypothetical protein
MVGQILEKGCKLVCFSVDWIKLFFHKDFMLQHLHCSGMEWPLLVRAKCVRCHWAMQAESIGHY